MVKQRKYIFSIVYFSIFNLSFNFIVIRTLFVNFCAIVVFMHDEIRMADLKDTQCRGKRNNKDADADGAGDQCRCGFTRIEIESHKNYKADTERCPKCNHDISFHPAGLPQQGNVRSVPSHCI